MIATNVEIKVNDGPPVRVVIELPVGEVVQHFADNAEWSGGPSISGVRFGAEFPDKSNDLVTVNYVKRDDYTDLYVSCSVKRLEVE